MRRPAIHRLTTKFAAILAIAAVGIVQPMLSACTCGVLTAQGGERQADSSQPLSACCSHQTESAPLASCCISGSDCGNSASGAHHCDDCSCCVSAEEFPLTPQITSAPTDDGTPTPLYLAASGGVLHRGLNGAAWQNAFDLASSGTPPGIRLHAFLSVWRN